MRLPQSRVGQSLPWLGLGPPRKWLALLSARACCWLLLHLVLTQRLRCVSVGPLSGLCSPRVSVKAGLPRPRCSPRQRLVLVPVRWLVSAQPSGLPRGACEGSVSLRERVPPASVVLLAKSLVLPLSPASRLFMKARERAVPEMSA